LEVVGRIPQNGQQSVGLARNLHLTHDLARAIHNADARVLDRNVQSSKIVHAALLLLMLGAHTTVTPFHLSLKRSAQKSSSYPQAAGRLPHLWVIFDRVQRGLPVGPFGFAPKSGHSASARVYE